MKHFLILFIITTVYFTKYQEHVIWSVCGFNSKVIITWSLLSCTKPGTVAIIKIREEPLRDVSEENLKGEAGFCLSLGATL
jgi:hypothetical protein